MKKRLALIVAFVIAFIIVSALLAACDSTAGGYQTVDTVWKFDRAIIALPNGEIVSGNVEKWRDFEDGDQLQIKIDGIWYLVHSTNCVLMKFED